MKPPPKRYPFASRAEGGVNRWKTNLSEAMRRDAERRRCPRCERKSALKRAEPLWPGAPPFWACRWCGWEGTGEERARARRTKTQETTSPAHGDKS